ncbi:amidase [Propionicicella superfundia]|uniref:amidase n=1 Tax=Propionicicella superfundia TaxID=348582 RepID=UPI00040A7AEF|nr:amidase family protein [Propionicicella superfundia]
MTDGIGTPTPGTGTELADASASEQRRLLVTGEVSARELLDAVIARIETSNRAINALVTLDLERAARRAAAADERQARGGPLGLLHGLPVAHKDLQDTAGVRTTYGSRAFADHVPRADAAVVTRMAAAGAISLGKSNTPEFGLGSHTVNAVFGVTRNPYAPDRSAGGSSGGAAAALAASMVSLADGSDMGGSLRTPASFCNVVGLRPTPGLVTRGAAEMGYWTLGVNGPMGRSVADVALLLAALAGHDPGDPVSVPVDPGPLRTLVSRGSVADLRGLRVGWCPHPAGFPVDPVVRGVLDDVARPAFERLGARVHPVDLPVDRDLADVSFRTLRHWAAARRFGRLVEERPELVGPNLVFDVAAGRSVTAERVWAALAAQTTLRRAALAVWRESDVLALPAAVIAPFPAAWDWPRQVAGTGLDDYSRWTQLAQSITLIGVPALVVPCGFTGDGLPVGIQLVGRPFGEVELLRIGAAFEQSVPAGRIRPPRPGDPSSS